MNSLSRSDQVRVAREAHHDGKRDRWWASPRYAIWSHPSRLCHMVYSPTTAGFPRVGVPHAVRRAEGESGRPAQLAMAQALRPARMVPSALRRRTAVPMPGSGISFFVTSSTARPRRHESVPANSST